MLTSSSAAGMEFCKQAFSGGGCKAAGLQKWNRRMPRRVSTLSLPFLSRLSNCAQNSPVVWAYD